MSAANQSGDRPLRFATYLAPNVYPVYDFIAAYIGERLNISTEIVHVASHSQFPNISADVSFICGLPYVYLARENPCPVDLLAAPVLEGERYSGRPVYFSDVIVHKDSSLRRFVDLEGHTWAYNELVSQSGYGITRHQLLQMNETNGFFRRVVNGRSHQNAIRLVAARKIDGAAIDSQVLAVEFRDHPELKQNLRVIDTLGPSTIQPVVTRRTLPDQLKADLRDVIVQIGDDPTAQPMLARGFFRGFVPIMDKDYDDIRAMLQWAEDAHFLHFH